MQFQQAKFVASYGTYAQIPPCDSIEVAFAGRSNVGKSTLINRIFQRKALARVSSVPGKTATINFYRVDPLTVVDLPGYGYARVAKSEKERWSGLISGYLAADRDLRLILLLIDMRHKPSKDDLQMIEFLVEAELPFLIVLTKADKLKRSQLPRAIANVEKVLHEKSAVGQEVSLEVIPFSGLTKQGRDDIMNRIEALCE